MKKVFSNPYFLHFFYCAILLIISGLLWFLYPNPRESREAESSKKCLSHAYHINRSLTQQITYAIQQNRQACNSFESQKLEIAADASNKSTDFLVKMVNKIQEELQNELNQNSSFLYHKNSMFPTAKILTINKIKAIENAFDSLANGIYFQNIDKKEWLLIQTEIKKIKEQILWDRLGSLSASSANAHLEVVKVAAANVNVFLLNNLFRKTGCNVLMNRFSIEVSPSQSTVKVGEQFNFDLALCDNAAYFGSDYKMFCDDVELPMQRGIALYEKTFQKSGRYRIKAQGKYINPITGQTETVNKWYVIEVL